MHLGFITGNILEKFTNPNYNIIYYPQNNLFDHLIGFVGNFNIMVFSASSDHCKIKNLEDIPNNRINLYNYNLCISNNLIEYTKNNLKNFHLNSIICTHSAKPPYIKKEDTLLINQRINNEIKIFFSEYVKDSWKFHANNTYYVKYGIPDAFIYSKPHNERKDILIINSQNPMLTGKLMESLKQKNLVCDCLDIYNLSVEDLNELFNNYKTCIDLNIDNTINMLCAIASGCIGIIPNTGSPEYKDLQGLFFINSLESIINTIESILNTSYDPNAASEDIKKAFPFDEFKNKMNNLIHKANREAFIL
jgi:hypothetical protein